MDKKIQNVLLLLSVFFVVVGIGYTLANSDPMYEYESHLESRNRNIVILNSEFEEWDMALSGVLRDKQLTYEEYIEMIDMAEEYREKANQTVNGLSQFDEFISSNELVLKLSGVDTSNARNRLSDDIIDINQNIDSIDFTIKELETFLTVPDEDQNGPDIF